MNTDALAKLTVRAASRREGIASDEVMSILICDILARSQIIMPVFSLTQPLTVDLC
ncbi:hypothetical protein [Nostoc sp.]|uniref:hypothetical protein n=1 Tax=Nostoc sp. TaxID=1180 RepID=UPI002FF9054C